MCERKRRSAGRLSHDQFCSGRPDSAAELGQALIGDRMSRRVGRLDACDCLQEVVSLQRVQLGIDRRGDRRRSRHVSQQRDLAEVVHPMRALVQPLGEDVELAVADDVEAVSDVSGSDDELAGGHLTARAAQIAPVPSVLLCC